MIRPGNEERRDAARPFFLQRERCLGDTFDAADAGADHDAGPGLIVVTRRLPAGMLDRLTGGAHRIDDELVDPALLLRLHPLVGIVGPVGAIAARDLAGDFRRKILDVEFLDSPGAALPGKQALPRDLDAATERRHHAESGDDDTSHVTFSLMTAA